MNKVKFLLLPLILIGIISCGDDFLDKRPVSSITEDSFYLTQEDALLAINAAYDVLQWELNPEWFDNGAGHFRWFWGDVMSDDSRKGGSGDNDFPALGELEKFEGGADNEMLSAEWEADYVGIYRANKVLEEVPDIEMDEFLKRRILAEARFIRAWFYFQLVNYFGDVPLITKTLSLSESYEVTRTPAEQVWDQIETDLKEAASNLPSKSEYSLSEIGRVTSGAANALLLKTFVFRQKWSDAFSTGELVIGSGEYFLESDYLGMFSLNGENGGGSVFEIQYQANSLGDWDFQRDGSFSNVFQRARGEFGGYGFNIPTQDFVDEFEEGDPRLPATVFSEGDQMGDRGIFTKDATGYPHDFYARKFFSNQTETASDGDPNVNGQTNDRAIRYADVLLLTAEAAFHIGNEGVAKNYVNQVRERARGGNNAVLANITASGNGLLEAIYHERRVELGLEGHRFLDLIRTQRAADELQGEGFNPSVHYLFPIPQAQIALSGGNLTQNPGY